MNQSYPPSGTLTFLFTDIENSTPLWDQHPEAMRSALAQHDAILKAAVESNNGQIIKSRGDGFHAAFVSPSDGVAAALAGQRAIGAEGWPEATGPLKVRMGRFLRPRSQSGRAGHGTGSWRANPAL